MRIGVIWVGYQCEDLLKDSLSPWITARKTRLGGDDWVICAVSIPFKGFEQPTALDSTVTSLSMGPLLGGQIDHLITSETPMTETEARGVALRWLRDVGKVEATWMVDSDEVYLEKDIVAISSFIVANPFVSSFRVSLRNAVFTKDQYLVEPFCPSRIHRIKTGSYIADSFWDDNNILYRGTITRDFKRDTEFASMTVPKECAFVKHMSWLSNERSRLKCEYQIRRWGQSSYRWNEKTNSVAFNEDYYRARGLPLPAVAREVPASSTQLP